MNVNKSKEPNILRYKSEADMIHGKHCNVLGEYCWTHGVKATANIPYWTKTHHTEQTIIRSPWGGATYNNTGDAIGYYGFTEAVIWANGDTETPKDNYTCVLCDSSLCKKGAPVLRQADDYKEIVTKRTYWDWAEKNAMRNVDTGDLIEPTLANPDSLRGDL